MIIIIIIVCNTLYAICNIHVLSAAESRYDMCTRGTSRIYLPRHGIRIDPSSAPPPLPSLASRSSLDVVFVVMLKPRRHVLRCHVVSWTYSAAPSVFQSIPPFSPYFPSSQSFAFLKCPFPKNPLLAANGEGCAEVRTKLVFYMSIMGS